MNLDILIKNVTAVTLQEGAAVIPCACIGVKDGRIAFMQEVCDKSIPCPLSEVKRVIDGEGKVLIPGLYNAHTHVPMTLLRGYANDRTLEDWLYNFIFPAEARFTPAMSRTGANLAIAEMIASGTISFSDMYFHMDTIAEAVDAAGVKANLSNGLITFDPENFVFEDSRGYSETMNMLNGVHKAPHGRIVAEASIHGVYTSTDAQWRRAAEFAREHSLRMYVHLSETATEHNGCVEKHGATPAQMFARHGVFDVPTTAAHTVWVTDEDISILAEKGVSAAHCPVSNLKLASGIAPVRKCWKKA